MKTPIEHAIILTAGGAASFSTSALPDYIGWDFAVAFLGAFILFGMDMTLIERFKEVVAGVFTGVAISLILRSFDSLQDADGIVRLSTFIAAILGIKGAVWIRNPAQAKDDVGALLSWLNEIRKLIGR